MRRPLGVALGAVLLASLVSGPGAGAFTIRDMLGRQLELPRVPTRIVSLVPSVTEIVYALGADDRLVGRTDFCDFPPAARAKPSVGGMLAPSLEVLVALRPDLVVATPEGNREETFAQLQRLGIPTYVVAAHRLDELPQVIASIGALTGRGAAVPPLVAALERRVALVQEAVRPLRRPRVLYVLWPDPLIVPGRQALVTDLIRLAGGQSITADDPDAYPRYSLEAAVARAPEVVVLANHGAAAGAIAPEVWRRLAGLPAIRAGRLHSVDGDLLHRYGPRVVDGLEQLARAIHPEAFR